MRARLAEGRSVEWSVEPGQAAANDPVAALAIENIEDAASECIIHIRSRILQTQPADELL
jgi:hypothetical protein